jgi:hypothetical protein
MGEAVGLRRVGYLDCPGGGQIVVENGIAYVAHMNAEGTTIADVRDPKNTKELARIPMWPGSHAHKVRIGNGIMVRNHEINPADRGQNLSADFKGGLGIYDISDPTKPREITRWDTAGSGVHRFDFDGRYVYGSPTVECYVGNIVMILDLKDPAKPEEVGRWWMPGQWTAGGETPTWKDTDHRCHHPLRMGNRLYTSYWHGGFVILNIDDMSKPTFVSGLDWSPPFPSPTHTALPIPFDIGGRRYLLVADEDVLKIFPGGPNSFMWMVDITDETRPVPVGSFQIEELIGKPSPDNSGCHQPVEKVRSTEIPMAWFAGGLRVVDIKNPHAPKEVARYIPERPPGWPRVSSNDVYMDDNGLIYLLDRVRGVEILERV